MECDEKKESYVIKKYPSSSKRTRKNELLKKQLLN